MLHFEIFYEKKSIYYHFMCELKDNIKTFNVRLVTLKITLGVTIF